jgi:DNA repair exonuclease SbcCD ATPase subunit
MNELLPTQYSQITAVDLYTDERTVDSVLNAVRTEVTSIVTDVSTKKGRDEIASIAYKVARSKTHLDDMGKELVADWKKRSAAVDAMRKKLRDGLDAIRDEVRAPLNEWEQTEAKRKSERMDALAKLKDHASISANNLPEYSLEQLAERRAALIDAKETVVADWWQEFESEAERLITEGIEKLELLIARKQQLMAEAEAERKKQEAERLAKEEETRKRMEAEAEARAQAQIVAAQLAQQQAEERAAQAKIEAERAAERAKLEAEQAAERAKAEAKAQAELAAKQAVEREQKRLALEQAQADAERQRRESDAKLRAMVENRIAEDVFKVIDTAVKSNADVTRALVDAMLAGKIRQVTVNFY